MLEEGVAVFYADEYLRKYMNSTSLTVSLKYKLAGALVRDFLKANPDAIRLLRSIEPSFRKINKDTFRHVNLSVPDLLIDTFLTNFEDWDFEIFPLC